MADYPMTLAAKLDVAKDTMAFLFDTNGTSYEFQAGQHADFAFFHSFEGDARDISRTFSLAGSPHNKEHVWIAMRMRNTGFKNALRVAPPGTLFKVSRPRGSFTLHRDATRPAVFLAGGIGITPMRSIVRWATHERLPHQLYLFYSNRRAEDAGFLEELKDLAKTSHSLTFIPTITRDTNPTWPYDRGPIDRRLLTEYLHSLNGPIYYVAGPSGMVAATTALLRSAGVTEDDIKTEEFGDYKSNRLTQS